MKDIAATVKLAQANQDWMLQLAELIAEQKRVFYVSCLNEGFTPEQALQLTQTYPH